MTITDFLKESLKFLKLISGPVLALLGYFVVTGIFCLRLSIFGLGPVIAIFLIYNVILAFRIVYFMQMFVSEDQSVINTKPAALIKNKERFEHINEYVLEGMINSKSIKWQTCNICKGFKPPRAHHCGICNRCFLRFNHHCTVFDVCIAFHNYKYYFQFCVSSLLYCALSLPILVIDLFTNRLNTRKIAFIYSLAITIIVIELLIISIEVYKHIILISNNETIVEQLAINRYLKNDHTYIHIFQEGPITLFSDSKDRTVLNPYNLGSELNWKQVFGDSIIKSILPIFTSKTDGIHWPTNDNDDNTHEMFNL
ncbi:ZDHC2 [Hepatospora eriocheir]|uniref:Palmitoyltransferase n=1 Tax=Hepatospora eriocheir TaxID=1081669 RepID=A0A1X0QHU3_9MICR|nr:ZDHC2 [Hepatospora eriocheir]